jgi:hypothetical protein
LRNLRQPSIHFLTLTPPSIYIPPFPHPFSPHVPHQFIYASSLSHFSFPIRPNFLSIFLPFYSSYPSHSSSTFCSAIPRVLSSALFNVQSPSPVPPLFFPISFLLRLLFLLNSPSSLLCYSPIPFLFFLPLFSSSAPPFLLAFPSSIPPSLPFLRPFSPLASLMPTDACYFFLSPAIPPTPAERERSCTPHRHLAGLNLPS